VSVGQDDNEDGNQGDDSPQGQAVQEGRELDNEDLPQPIAKRRRLIESPLLPKLLPHNSTSISCNFI
jgi:hypothetical protein